MNDQALFTHKVHARLTGLCVGVVITSAVCLLIVILGIGAYQKAQSFNHVIERTIAHSMHNYHQSVEVHPPTVMIHGHEPTAGTNGHGTAEVHGKLLADLREFRTFSRQLNAVFEQEERGWITALDGNLRYIADLLSLSRMPDNVRYLWANTGTGDTIGEMLEEQYRACLLLCKGYDLNIDERDAMIHQLHELVVDELMPKLSMIRVAKGEWQSRRVVLAKVLFISAFATIVLLVVLARSVLVIPLLRELNKAASDLDAQNKDLEARVQRRTQDVTLALHKAEAAVVAKQNFLTNMSHELRTPMNGVLGIAALLDASELEERQRGLVQTIMQSGKSLMRILDDVLETASIASGKLTIVHRPSFLREVVQDTVALYLSSAANKGLTLRFDCQNTPSCPVMIDPDRLQQVLGNLVQNAVKFTDSGSIDVTLDEVRRGALVEACITVRDTGNGITLENQSRIFEPFERVPGTEIVEGTGLGLALCKALIVEMGGSIEVKSAPGQGACFTLVLTPHVAEMPVGPANEAAA